MWQALPGLWGQSRERQGPAPAREGLTLGMPTQAARGRPTPTALPLRLPSEPSAAGPTLSPSPHPGLQLHPSECGPFPSLGRLHPPEAPPARMQSRCRLVRTPPVPLSAPALQGGVLSLPPSELTPATGPTSRRMQPGIQAGASSANPSGA